jgi:hypothetical protein
MAAVTQYGMSKAQLGAISSTVFATLVICATTIKDVSFRLSQLSMTSTAGLLSCGAEPVQ